MQHPTDAALLELFEHDPERAWEAFIDKHAGLILSCLRRLSYDYDLVMDRFVYVCEKLCEGDWQRLKGLQYLGTSDEITPWLRQVVRRLALNYTQSQDGRRRLLRPIERLDRFDQKVFEAYFWQRQTPPEICGALGNESSHTTNLLDVLDSQERIFRALSSRRLARLVQHLDRRQPAVSLSGEADDRPLERTLECPGADPEQELLRGEWHEHLQVALAALEPRDRRLLKLRYEEKRAVKEVGRILQIGNSETRSALRSARRRLRCLIRRVTGPGQAS